MVETFHFARGPQIRFGPGKLNEVPSLAKEYGNSVVLVTGRHSFLHSVRGKEMVQTFHESGTFPEYVTITREPSPDLIDQAVNRLRGQTVDVVIGVGGGSVLDGAKAISAMLPEPGNVADYLEGVGKKVHSGRKVPFIAVPSTSGTGSEATKNAVISLTGKNGFKRSLRHDNFVPDLAIVDPELTLSCPPDLTAACGMDCFTQLVESYLSTNGNSLTDALAFEGLKAIKYSLINCFTEGTNIRARTCMSFAALTSGICLANAGLGAVHGFASSLGGMFDIPHGIVCGSLMARTNQINVRELRKSDPSGALKKYTDLGKLFLDEEGKREDYYIDGFVSYLEYLTGIFRLPGLKPFGVSEGDVESICTITETKSNPVRLTRDHLAEILSSRLF